jgi:starch phosphorylase
LSGSVLPVYFLDTALPENDPWDQSLTDYLYGGENRYRLCQEALLGLGGVAMLRALGHDNVDVYHKNEGHAALLALALLEDETVGRPLKNFTPKDIEAVRRKCVFTTHTPVPAGHDQFPIELVRKILGNERTSALEAAGCCPKGILNMTYMSLFFSYYINGVSMRHEELSQSMFPNYPVNSITNGVHAGSWVSTPFCVLYDKHIPEWRHDNLYLRYAINITLDEILEAHAQAKHELIEEVERRTNKRFDQTSLTIGFARRATTYKRADLLFSAPDRLKRIVSRVGPIQVIYAGKAHPRDEGGKALIRSIFRYGASFADTVRVVYLEEYDMALAKYLCAGVDLWLNTPHKPHEASGTSGMKAALNGVPSLSILDGWWIEGHIEGVTGWSIGDGWESESDPSREALSLYDKLEYVIGPMFYERPDAFAQVMRSAISLNGSFFNTQRMVSQYLGNAYKRTREIIDNRNKIL